MASRKTKTVLPEETTPVTPMIRRLRRIEDKIIIVHVEGVTPVIPHKWSEKSIRIMADKQQQTSASARPQREPKNPQEEADDSCYWLRGCGAIPAVAFKAAMIGGARFYQGVTMASGKVLFYVEGEGDEQLVSIGRKKSEGIVREDTPRNASGTPDLRYRYSFFPWSADLRVHYLPSMVDEETVIALMDAGGRGGVGDWRPSSPHSMTGTFGQFRVTD